MRAFQGVLQVESLGLAVDPISSCVKGSTPAIISWILILQVSKGLGPQFLMQDLVASWFEGYSKLRPKPPKPETRNLVSREPEMLGLEP